MVCVHHKICTNFKTKHNSDVQHPTEIKGASVVTPSTIPDSSSNMIGGIHTTIKDKKRIIDIVYTSCSWMDKDSYGIMKVRQVIQNQVFKNLKFVKGEG